MHPELLNNSLFLRYYNQWLEKPGSIVFASIAEFLLKYGHVGEAIRVCREGLKHTPNLVTGRMALAKALIMSGEREEADEELRKVLSIVPSHTKAQKLRVEVEVSEIPVPEEEDVDLNMPAWQTVTMAKIYSSQGHHDRAREIYQTILSRDPSNEAARNGLNSLGGGE